MSSGSPASFSSSTTDPSTRRSTSRRNIFPRPSSTLTRRVTSRRSSMFRSGSLLVSSSVPGEAISGKSTSVGAWPAAPASPPEGAPAWGAPGPSAAVVPGLPAAAISPVAPASTVGAGASVVASGLIFASVSLRLELIHDHLEDLAPEDLQHLGLLLIAVDLDVVQAVLRLAPEVVLRAR